jgi:hypothetical protein
MGEEFLEDVPLPHLFDKAQQLHALADSSRLENVRPFLFYFWLASGFFFSLSAR